MPVQPSFSATSGFKRIAVFMDGTWQKDTQDFPTNIGKMYKAAQRSSGGIPQISKHIDGVGTDGFVDKLLGGALGWGLPDKIMEAWIFLSEQYRSGDKIYIAGYSRGAYSARSLAGMIYKSGLMDFKKLAQELGRDEHDVRKDKRLIRRMAERAYLFYKDDETFLKGLKRRGLIADDVFENRPSAEASRILRKSFAHTDEVGVVTSEIEALVCFDTVGSLGIPTHIIGNDSVREKYAFHDMRLSRIVRNARHALAIDEERSTFMPTYMETDEHNTTHLQQIWFAGGHGIGGGDKRDANGNPDHGLADLAGLWILKEMETLGFKFNPKKVRANYSPNPLSQPSGIFFDSDGLVSGDLEPRAIPNGDPIRLPDVFTRYVNLADYRPPSIMDSPDVLKQLQEYAHSRSVAFTL